jgi:FtsH-binding integral membrane protein
MSDYGYRSSTAWSPGEQTAVAQREFLRQVFGWMALALALTTGVAIYLNATTDVVAYFNDHTSALWVLFGVQLVMVFTLSLGLQRLPVGAVVGLFGLYAGLTGVTFAVLFAVYTTGSVVGAFAGATGVFAGMAAYGYATEKDLSGWGGILFGALIGLIVASVVFAFTGGETFNLIIGFAGVVIFAGLTAYDMQKIKQIGADARDEDTTRKLAVYGALQLYLDFINLVISLLRIFGARR